MFVFSAENVLKSIETKRISSWKEKNINKNNGDDSTYDDDSTTYGISVNLDW